MEGGKGEIPALMGRIERRSKLYQILESDASNMVNNKAGKER